MFISGSDTDTVYDTEGDEGYTIYKYSEESCDDLSDEHDTASPDDDVEGNDDTDSLHNYKWTNVDITTHVLNFRGAYHLSEIYF
jgi:hypothetical protein